MERLQDLLGISFDDLEILMFQKLQRKFAEAMREVLLKLDDLLLERRDKSRYKEPEFREKEIETLLGVVRFKRRYYLDCETGERVFLLDRALGIEECGQISPGLAIAAIFQAVSGPSYRSASESLEKLYRRKVISHETIRQLVLEMGTWLSRRKTRKQDDSSSRRPPVAFIEADGFWISLQEGNRDRLEVQMAVTHEGWERLTPGSNDYKLVNKDYHLGVDAEDFWDDVSREMPQSGAIGDDTLVVINGDRAAWIRKGVEYFPNAIYQVDRYHLKRDLRSWLAGTRYQHKALSAVDTGDCDGLITVLARARERIEDEKRQRKIDGLLKDLHEMPEAFRDYRERLREKGYDTSGMRGMGAAESNVDCFANRLCKRGQSWSVRGAAAMLYALAEKFTGRLKQHAARLGQVHDLIDREEELAVHAGRIARRVVESVRVKQAHPLIKGAGTTRSGGMSRLFHRLNEVSLSDLI